MAYNCQVLIETEAIAGIGLSPSEEIINMAQFCRCNALLSLALNEEGEGCRYVAKADTDQGVVDDMVAHMAKVHEVDGTELVGNIKAATKSTRR